jgi:hypothetical protein
MHLGGQHHDDDAIKMAMLQWMPNQVAGFFEDGIQKLIVQYDKCFNDNGNYVEK